MATLNKSSKGKNITTNLEGSKAYKQSDKMLLVSQVLTSFYNEQKFYGDNSKDIIKNAKRLVQSSDENANFVSKLCVYARKEFNLRTISQVLAVVLANEKNGRKYARNTIKNVCLRVDDMLNILAFQINEYGHTVPNQMKLGITDAFNKFDEYQFAKYNRKTQIKLRDALKLTHPKPKDQETRELFGKILNDTLETPYTWEVELSTKGNTKEVWEELIQSKKVGYMAILRNLRNILKANVDSEYLDMVYSYLENENAIKNSKQLPFRWYEAYKTLERERLGTNKTFNVLENAIEKSLNNIEKLKGLSYISTDVSGSMTWNVISKKSNVRPVEIGALLLSMANKICDDSITTTFHTSCKPCVLNPKNGVINNAKSVRIDGGGTDMMCAIEYLIDNNIKVDRIIIFSDNEVNSRKNVVQSIFNVYRSQINPNCWLHAIDLEGYGTVQFNEHDKHVNLIAGWSEKLLQFIPMVEKGANGIVKEIEDYDFN